VGDFAAVSPKVALFGLVYHSGQCPLFAAKANISARRLDFGFCPGADCRAPVHEEYGGAFGFRKFASVKLAFSTA
jgi:hypothetical protein